jgi:hypothetical protein
MVGYFSTPITCRLRRLRSLPNVSPSSTGRPEIVVSFTTPVSRTLPPGSGKPFRLSLAGLRTDLEGFELTILGARSFAAVTARSGLHEEENV